MNEDELHSRCLRLEKAMRTFNISTDVGSVLGGFGKLKPPSDNIHERITNIRESASGLLLVGGGGLEAAGSFKDGYIIKGQPGVRGVGSLPEGTVQLAVDSACVIGSVQGFEPLAYGGLFYSSFQQYYATPSPVVNTPGPAVSETAKFLHLRLEITDATGNEYNDETYTPSYVDGIENGANVRRQQLIHNITNGGSGYTDTYPITVDYTRSNEYTGPAMRTNIIGFGLPPFPNTFNSIDGGYYYAPGVGIFYAVDPTWGNLAIAAGGGFAMRSYASSFDVSGTDSDDTYTYLINAFQYKFVFAAQSGPFRIKWTEGTTKKSENIPAGATHSTVHVVMPPAVDRVYSGYDEATSKYVYSSGPDPIFVFGITTQKL